MTINKTEDTILKFFKNNESAGNIFRELLLNKSLEQKYKVVSSLIDLASVLNKNIKIRSKVLAFLSFLKDMYPDPTWAEGKIILEFNDNVIKILEDNSSEIILKLQRNNYSSLKEDKDLYDLTQQLVFVIGSFTINVSKYKSLKNCLFNKLDLLARNKNEQLSIGEDYIYKRIQELSKNYE